MLLIQSHEMVLVAAAEMVAPVFKAQHRALAAAQLLMRGRSLSPSLDPGDIDALTRTHAARPLRAFAQTLVLGVPTTEPSPMNMRTDQAVMAFMCLLRRAVSPSSTWPMLDDITAHLLRAGASAADMSLVRATWGITLTPKTITIRRQRGAFRVTVGGGWKGDDRDTLRRMKNEKVHCTNIHAALSHLPSLSTPSPVSCTIVAEDKTTKEEAKVSPLGKVKVAVSALTLGVQGMSDNKGTTTGGTFIQGTTEAVRVIDAPSKEIFDRIQDLSNEERSPDLIVDSSVFVASPVADQHSMLVDMLLTVGTSSLSATVLASPPRTQMRKGHSQSTHRRQLRVRRNKW